MKIRISEIIAIIISLIACALAFKSFLDYRVHPPDFAGDLWHKTKNSDIKSVILAPLLDKNVACAITIKEDINVNDQEIINALWKGMQGKYRISKFIDAHWLSSKQMRVIFNLSTNERIAFRITFHAGYNIADYYQLKNENDVYCITNYASKASKKLYEILNHQVNLNKISWVFADAKCWSIKDRLIYKGCDYDCGQ